MGTRKGSLTHLDERGRARMVDVGAKPETDRIAVATAAVKMKLATLALVQAGSGKKGDVFSTARLAAIAALKRTSDWIPLCHPVRVVGTDVVLEADRKLPVTGRLSDRVLSELAAMTGRPIQ